MSGRTVYVIKIGEVAYLRVRKPEDDIRGSMLLMLEGKRGVWDCMRCQENTHTHYTEANWVKRFEQVYAFDGHRERREMIKENNDFVNMSKYRAPKDADEGLENADKCLLSKKDDTMRIAHAEWNRERHEVELLLVQEFPQSDHGNIAHIAYTSILLTFALANT